MSPNSKCFFLSILQLFLLLSSVSSQDCKVDPSFPGFNPNLYTVQTAASTTSVSIDQVTPPITTPPNVDIYLGQGSCLGYLGPIGTYGPLGSLGPLGSNSWSASYWISGDGMNWANFSKEITGLGGPLSASGPLGSSGPLSPDWIYGVMPCIDGFAANLAASGLWTVLGPLGPLGPMGALGPLGPIGATGFSNDTNGQFLDGEGKVVRSVRVGWDTNSMRTWELFEFYTKEFALQSKDNDCSWLVESVISESGDNYTFTSLSSQYVTILVVPLKQLDDFDLSLKDRAGNVIASSNTSTFIEWIQIRVPANTVLTATVVLSFSGHFLESDYRIYVTGSQYFDATNIAGPHLLPYVPNKQPLEDLNERKSVTRRGTVASVVN